MRDIFVKKISIGSSRPAIYSVMGWQTLQSYRMLLRQLILCRKRFVSFLSHILKSKCCGGSRWFLVLWLIAEVYANGVREAFLFFGSRHPACPFWGSQIIVCFSRRPISEQHFPEHMDSTCQIVCAEFVSWVFVLHFMSNDLYIARVHIVFKQHQRTLTAYHYRSLSLFKVPARTCTLMVMNWWETYKLKRLPWAFYWSSNL